jgi:hypothetical protein
MVLQIGLILLSWGRFGMYEIKTAVYTGPPAPQRETAIVLGLFKEAFGKTFSGGASEIL